MNDLRSNEPARFRELREGITYSIWESTRPCINPNYHLAHLKNDIAAAMEQAGMNYLRGADTCTEKSNRWHFSSPEGALLVQLRPLAPRSTLMWRLDWAAHIYSEGGALEKAIRNARSIVDHITKAEEQPLFAKTPPAYRTTTRNAPDETITA